MIATWSSKLSSRRWCRRRRRSLVTLCPSGRSNLRISGSRGGPRTLADLRGQVVLIRFFTGVGCPYCRGTAPSLNEFHQEFSARGLVVIGIYTPKPRPRTVPLDEVRECVKAYGFEFPVAIDADWSALRRLWLDRVPDAEYTSSSLLIDRHGILRHVHEGGIYAKDAADPKARQDYQEMRRAIVEAVSQR
jgi:peroxiredoxin